MGTIHTSGTGQASQAMALDAAISETGRHAAEPDNGRSAQPAAPDSGGSDSGNSDRDGSDRGGSDRDGSGNGPSQPGLTDRDTLDAQIRQAMGTHAAMKRKLRNAARGGLLPRPAFAISSDCACRFGKWLHHLGKDPEIAGSPHFRAVVTAHAGFHKAAGRVARLIEDGQRERAAQMLDALCYRQASDILIAEMEAWQRSL